MVDNPSRKLQNAPAYKLVGLTLENGWRVISMHKGTDGGTGGKYSVCYHIERDGQKAFLKALDFSRAADNKELDFPRALQALTFAFNFERDVLRMCAERR